MKSSAASISILLPSALCGRVATPIRPSGLPVVKKKGSAYAAFASTRINANVENTPVVHRIAILHPPSKGDDKKKVPRLLAASRLGGTGSECERTTFRCQVKNWSRKENRFTPV